MLLAVASFSGGFAARFVIQEYGATWLEGFVSMMGGLYLCLLTAAVLSRFFPAPPSPSRRVEFYLVAVPFGILAGAVFLFGAFLVVLGASRLITLVQIH